MRFEFAAATRIIFGAGTLKQIGPIAADIGKKALVMIGLHVERAAPLLDALSAQQIDYVTLLVSGEPTTGLAREGVWRAREAGCDLVIGFGGGSAIDAGKAIAALMTNPAIC